MSEESNVLEERRLTPAERPAEGWEAWVPEPGTLYGDLPEEVYHQGPGLSQTALKRIQRSPAHFREALVNPPEPTPAMAVGSAIDTIMFEPDEFDTRFAIRPEGMDGRTKEGRAWAAEAQGRTILSAGDGANVIGMEEALRAHPTASILFGEGLAQASFYWDEDGVLCRGRGDWLNPAHFACVDLKKTQDAREHRLVRAVADYGYAMQDAWYRHGLERCGWKVEHFVFVFVEEAPPHGIAVVELEPSWSSLGRQQWEEALARYVECEKAGTWPGYDPTPGMLFKPAWVR